MPPEDRTRILHMIEAAERAANLVTGRRRTDLNSDQMLLFALVRAIEVVGEAAGRVTESTRRAAADIPWSLVVFMRNRLIHAYFDVDNDVVWKTATEGIASVTTKAARTGPRALTKVSGDDLRLPPATPSHDEPRATMHLG
jgi:uncharacterized protein with HEPN domain